MNEFKKGFFDPANYIDSLTDTQNSPEGYSLEDDDEDGLQMDDSDVNMNSDPQDDDPEDENNEHKQFSPFRLLFEMMLNPVEGWKKIRRAKITPEHIARGCFYPILGLAAASCFMECIYNSATTLSMAMTTAVTIFVALFLGNFLALAFVKMMMPTAQKKIADTSYGKKFMMYLLSTLGLFWTLYQCLPMVGPVVCFTPLWTIYLAMRGARFFRFPEDKENLLTAILCVIVIAAPVIIYWVFDMVMPSPME